MLKVFCLLLILLLVQTAHANDFLRSGKQLLVCSNNASFVRINWEDWEVENKSFSIRTKNLLVKFSPIIDRNGAENIYRIDHTYAIYENGKSTAGGGGGFEIGPVLSAANIPIPMKLLYIDKEIIDSEIPKICGI
jgi:hypothetical protein